MGGSADVFLDLNKETELAVSNFLLEVQELCNLFAYHFVPIMNSTMEFFLNVFTEFSKFNDKIFVLTIKGLEPDTSCVRDQDATTLPARRVQETGSLN